MLPAGAAGRRTRERALAAVDARKLPRRGAAAEPTAEPTAEEDGRPVGLGSAAPEVPPKKRHGQKIIRKQQAHQKNRKKERGRTR